MLGAAALSRDPRASRIDPPKSCRPSPTRARRWVSERRHSGDEPGNRPQLPGGCRRDVEILGDLDENGRERNRAGLRCEEAEKQDGADGSVAAARARYLSRLHGGEQSGSRLVIGWPSVIGR